MAVVFKSDTTDDAESKSFRFIITGEFILNEAEIFTTSAPPENLTPEEVAAYIRKAYGNVPDWLADWKLGSLIDVTVEEYDENDNID